MKTTANVGQPIHLDFASVSIGHIASSHPPCEPTLKPELLPAGHCAAKVLTRKSAGKWVAMRQLIGERNVVRERKIVNVPRMEDWLLQTRSPETLIGRTAVVNMALRGCLDHQGKASRARHIHRDGGFFLPPKSWGFVLLTRKCSPWSGHGRDQHDTRPTLWCMRRILGGTEGQVE